MRKFLTKSIWYQLSFFSFRKYQFADCHFSINLTCDFDLISHLHTTVEVYGELRLIDKSNEKNSESSHSLISQMINLNSYLEEESSNCSNPEVDRLSRLENRFNSIKNNFMPSIQIHTLRSIRNAREILEENLRFRLTKKLKSQFKHSKKWKDDFRLIFKVPARTRKLYFY